MKIDTGLKSGGAKGLGANFSQDGLAECQVYYFLEDFMDTKPLIQKTSPDRRPGCSLTSGATDGIATDQGSRNDAQDATIGVGGHRCYASHLPVSKWSVAVCLGKHQLVKHFELGMSKK